MKKFILLFTGYTSEREVTCKLIRKICMTKNFNRQPAFHLSHNRKGTFSITSFICIQSATLTTPM